VARTFYAITDFIPGNCQ